MVDAPSAVPEEFPAEEAQELARDRLFALISRLAEGLSSSTRRSCQACMIPSRVVALCHWRRSDTE